MFKSFLLLLVLMCAAGNSGWTAEVAEKAPPEQATRPASVTVAVLDFEGTLPGNAEFGSQMAEILGTRLSMNDTMIVVERTKLGQIMTEHKLKLAGMVDQQNAAEIGKLVGARLLVMGKAFIVDKKLTIVTKVVGVETGQFRGTIREVDMNKPLSEAILSVSDDVAAIIKNNSADLLPQGAAPTDPMIAIKKALAAKTKPTVAIIVPEKHLTQVVRMDPAVETEIKKSLIACGFKVMDTGENDLADWAKAAVKSKDQPWPAALDKADYVIVGEAFSEFAARTGDLVTCAARAEINIIDRKTGQVLLAERQTERAIDLAENIAGKSALQKSGHMLSIRVLEHFVKILPDAPAEKASGK